MSQAATLAETKMLPVNDFTILSRDKGVLADGGQRLHGGVTKRRTAAAKRGIQQ